MENERLSLKFNASHVVDPTAEKAIIKTMNEKQPEVGQIWTNKNGKNQLIIAVQRGFCNVLNVVDDGICTADRIDVDGYGITMPKMISYMIERDYGSYVGKATAETMIRINNEIKQGLGISNLAGATKDVRIDELNAANKMLSEINCTVKQEKTIVEHERDMFKTLYENLMNKLIERLTA